MIDVWDIAEVLLTNYVLYIGESDRVLYFYQIFQ